MSKFTLSRKNNKVAVMGKTTKSDSESTADKFYLVMLVNCDYDIEYNDYCELCS